VVIFQLQKDNILFRLKEKESQIGTGAVKWRRTEEMKQNY
jgi:hypothetical protein